MENQIISTAAKRGKEEAIHKQNVIQQKFQGQNVLRTKRPMDKTSYGQNVLLTKRLTDKTCRPRKIGAAIMEDVDVGPKIKLISPN